MFKLIRSFFQTPKFIAGVRVNRFYRGSIDRVDGRVVEQPPFDRGEPAAEQPAGGLVIGEPVRRPLRGEAKRLGGSKSLGMQRSTAVDKAPSAPATAAAPAAGAAGAAAAPGP